LSLNLKEKQEIPLRCGNNKCGKTFNWEYHTRNVLRLERCADKFLEKMEEIATAKPSDYDKIASNAAVNNSATDAILFVTTSAVVVFVDSVENRYIAYWHLIKLN